MGVYDDLNNKRIDQFPSGEPDEGDYVLYWSIREGRTKKLPAQLFASGELRPAGQNFEWIADRKNIDLTPYPYNLNDVVTRGGNLYQSLVANNSSVPGVSDTWLLITKSKTGGFWEAGAYTDVRPWVFSNHSGITSIYELIDPTRPFISTNIATETNEGKWKTTSGKIHIDLVNTIDEIILDLKHDSQRRFKGIQNVDGPRIWSLLNAELGIEWKFIFTLSTIGGQEMPDNFKIADPKFNILTKIWLPKNIGDYLVIATYDGMEYWHLTFEGPFGGGGNLAPQIFDVIITDNGATIGGVYTYFDSEGDPENNQLSYVYDLIVTAANNNPGTVATASFIFKSPSKYAPGAHIMQWYRENEDGSDKQPIPGANLINRAYTSEDAGKIVSIGVKAVQVAPAPANGNPIGNEVFSAGTLIQDVIAPVLPRLDLGLWYNHAAKFGTYDEVNFRIPDAGTSGAGNFFTSPDANTRPTYNNVTKDLTFDNTVYAQHFTFPNVSSGGSKTIEIVGTFKVDSLAGVNEALVSLSTNIWAKIIKSGDYISARSSSITPDNNFDLLPNTPYAYRIMIILATTIEITIQLNYDEDTNTYLLNNTYVGASQGASLAAGTGRWGVAHDTTPATTEPFKGVQRSLGIRLGSLLPTADDNVKKLWRELRDNIGY